MANGATPRLISDVYGVRNGEIVAAFLREPGA